MRIFIIAGEASGDLHAAQLIKELKKRSSNIEIQAWAGDRTLATGVLVSKHIRDLAYMGFWEVLKHLPQVLLNFRICKKEIWSFKPDKIVFIDYPGFNLRIAAWTKKQSFQNTYYITPQVWAWNPSRTKSIEKNFDQIITVLPMAQLYYQNKSIKSYYVGHPVIDRINAFEPNPQFYEINQLDNRPIVALFPGSREQEIKKCLPVMLSLVEHYPGYQFCVSQMKHLPEENYLKFIAQFPGSERPLFIENQNYDLFHYCQKAIITSGTASLEAALFDVPQVVCYKTSFSTYHLAKLLARVSFISLVNLIAQEEIVTELIQGRLNSRSLATAFDHLDDPTKLDTIKRGYREVKSKLGTGAAAATAAKLILSS